LVAPGTTHIGYLCCIPIPTRAGSPSVVFWLLAFWIPGGLCTLRSGPLRTSGLPRYSGLTGGGFCLSPPSDHFCVSASVQFAFVFSVVPDSLSGIALVGNPNPPWLGTPGSSLTTKVPHYQWLWTPILYQRGLLTSNCYLFVMSRWGKVDTSSATSRHSAPMSPLLMCL
jgi:hypothetical protein